jgi:hypothetical protein
LLTSLRENLYTLKGCEFVFAKNQRTMNGQEVEKILNIPTLKLSEEAMLIRPK